MGLDVVGDRIRVLDRLAVHVYDIQSSVGTIHEVDRAEPVVRRGQELGARVGAPRDDQRSITIERLAMDQIAADVADESVATEFGRIGVAAINRHAGSRREISDSELLREGERAEHGGIGNAPPRSNHAPRLGRAFAKYGGGRSLFSDRANGAWRSEVRVATQISLLEHDLLDVVAVVADEAVSPIVEAEPVLFATRDGRDGKRRRIERQILPVKLADLFAVADERAAVAPGGKDDTVIETPLERVGHGLNVVAA